MKDIEGSCFLLLLQQEHNKIQLFCLVSHSQDWPYFPSNFINWTNKLNQRPFTETFKCFSRNVFGWSNPDSIKVLRGIMSLIQLSNTYFWCKFVEIEELEPQQNSIVLKNALLQQRTWWVKPSRKKITIYTNRPWNRPRQPNALNCTS